MIRLTGCRRATLLGVAASLLVAAAPLSAQTADEHAAHHPASSPAAPSQAPSPGAPKSPAMGGMEAMAGMMEGCEGEGCGSPAQDPLNARVLALKPGDDAGRAELAAESHRRMRDGAALAAQAAREASWAADMRDAGAIEQARTRLQEARGLFESGASAHQALSRGAQAPQGALDWLADQMSLSLARGEAQSVWLGATPAHLLLMAALAMIAGSLVGLQLLRSARAKSILSTAAAAASVPPPPAAVQTGAAQRSADPSAPVVAAPSAVEPAAARPGRWSGLLRVAQVIRETPTVSTFRLTATEGDRLPFGFAPGQFLQVEVEPAPGASAKRSYTIASSPTRSGYVELTVKREDQGVVSAHLHDRVATGDLVRAAGPFGHFTFNGTDAESIVLIAGGVGITPMMSVLRYLTDLAWPGDIFFIYSARSPEEVVFREEIEYLERRHPNLRTLVMVAARTPGTSWLGPEGQLTRELLKNEVPEIGSRRIHLCGPPGMMAAVKAILQELGVPEGQLRTEAFGPASLPAHEPAPSEAAPAPANPAQAPPIEVAPATVTFSVSGVAAALPNDTTVLEAAEGAGVEIPYSCRVGVCGVCVVKLKQGQVTMAVEEGLDPADKSQGYVLACQAKSAGGDLVVEA